MDELWKLFEETGNINAYLAYKKAAEKEKEKTDNNEFQC